MLSRRMLAGGLMLSLVMWLLALSGAVPAQEKEPGAPEARAPGSKEAEADARAAEEERKAEETLGNDLASVGTLVAFGKKYKVAEALADAGGILLKMAKTDLDGLEADPDVEAGKEAPSGEAKPISLESQAEDLFDEARSYAKDSRAIEAYIRTVKANAREGFRGVKKAASRPAAPKPAPRAPAPKPAPKVVTPHPQPKDERKVVKDPKLPQPRDEKKPARDEKPHPKDERRITDEKKIAGDERKIARDEKKIAGDEKRIAGDERKIARDEKRIAGDERKIAKDEKKIAGDERKIARDEKRIAGDERKIARDEKAEARTREERSTTTGAPRRHVSALRVNERHHHPFTWAGGRPFNLFFQATGPVLVEVVDVENGSAVVWTYTGFSGQYRWLPGVEGRRFFVRLVAVSGPVNYVLFTN